MPQINLSDIFSFPSIDGLRISSFFSKPILAGILVLYFTIYCVITGILFYHWRVYGMGSKKVIFAETIFLLVSIALFVFAGVSITYN